jgi:PPOX class probable F420-dependent enzyme
VTDTTLDLQKLDRERVAVLGTTKPDGTVHLVPVVFAVSGDTVVTAVDWKAKSGRKLARLTNIEANPTVSLLTHVYDDADWDRLRWIRLDGSAAITESGGDYEQAIEALVAKYPQYLDRPPEGPVIVITPENISYWEAKD